MAHEVFITDADVASMDVVNDAVREEAEAFRWRWIAALSSHIVTGEFIGSIDLKPAGDKDYLVTAETPYVQWAEYGHDGVITWTDDEGVQHHKHIGPVEGIHSVREAL
ncbi:hypothetical protein ACFVH6_25730 [Spirillospora sp. NPDC127200]